MPGGKKENGSRNGGSDVKHLWWRQLLDNLNLEMLRTLTLKAKISFGQLFNSNGIKVSFSQINWMQASFLSNCNVTQGKPKISFVLSYINDGFTAKNVTVISAILKPSRFANCMRLQMKASWIFFVKSLLSESCADQSLNAFRSESCGKSSPSMNFSKHEINVIRWQQRVYTVIASRWTN